MSTPSLDIVSRLDFAELDNAINNLKKVIATRFDFKGSVWSIEVDQKEKKIKIVAEDGTKHKGIHEEFTKCIMRRGIDPQALDWKDPEPGAAGNLKRTIEVKSGLDQETAKQITKIIKESKLKVQASIQGEEVRVTSKQIDDLQAVMKMLPPLIKVPLQFVNMKR